MDDGEVPVIGVGKRLFYSPLYAGLSLMVRVAPGGVLYSNKADEKHGKQKEDLAK